MNDETGFAVDGSIEMNGNKLLLNALIALVLVTSMLSISASAGHAQSDQLWSEPVNLSNSGASTKPSIVVDSRGAIHVIWLDEVDGYKYTESLDGKVWSSPKIVNYPFQPIAGLKLTLVAGDNVIHIFWQYADSQQLFYSQSLPSNLDAPGSWTGFTKLADAVAGYDVKIGNRGKLYIGYISSRGTDTVLPGVIFQRLDGTRWSQPEIIYSSPYYRSLSTDDANIHLGVAEQSNADNVFIVWDDRSQKRVFLSQSLNDGNSWEDVVQLSGPEDYVGLTLSFDVNIAFHGNDPLVLWWVGSPEARCSLYSQRYPGDVDQGNEPDIVRVEFSFCPQRSDFIFQYGDYPLLMLGTQDEVSFVAWNGTSWSEVQDQRELSVFENPVTYNGVLFGCKKFAVYEDGIYSVGCDAGGGGDIWFRSRELGTLEEWFPPPSAWRAPVQLTSVGQEISMLTSVGDENNNIHAFWIQSSFLDEVGSEVLEYARWNDSGWSKPVAILAKWDGRPIQFAVSTGIQDRVLVTWIDGETGELLFSWANSDRAVNQSEWDDPIYIPTNSRVISSPSILADASGRIIIAYAAPVNEQRGVYFVTSDNAGMTWSGPFILFDAFAAGWDMVDKPRLALSGDGRLHVLFERFSPQGDQQRSVGLYYSQSIDGGVAWIEAELVSEQHITWSHIVADDRSIHRLWQEKNGARLVDFHQFSEDGGISWSTPFSILSETAGFSFPSISLDRNGNLHFMKIVQQDRNVISHLEWNDSKWNPQESYQLSDNSLDVYYSLASSVTPNGDLFAISLIGNYDLAEGELINELESTYRLIDVQSSNGNPRPALIATPGSLAIPIADGQEIIATSTPGTPVANLNDPSASLSRNRNLAGILFLVAALILTVVILRPRLGSNTINKRKI